MKGSVFFHKDRWCVQIYWEKKKYRIWKYNDEPMWKRSTAEKLLNRIRSEIDEGPFNPKTYLPDSPLSVREYAARWLTLIKVRPSTHTAYRHIVNKYIIPYWKDKDIRKIRHSDLVEFNDSIKSPMRFNVMTCFKSMMRWAWRNQDISQMPPFPKISAPDTGPIRYLDYETQKRALSFIPERHRPVFEFGMEYGLRIGEVRALMWDCVTDKEITIRRTFSTYTLSETTKTSKIRAFGVTHNARLILGSIKTTSPTFVFVNECGKPYSINFLWKTWTHACEEAGVKINLYNAFRHSLACQLLDQGVPMDDVQTILGHTRADMTRRYGRRSQEQLTSHLNNRTATVYKLGDHQVTKTLQPTN